MRWKALKYNKEVIIYYLKLYISNTENYTHLIPPQLDISNVLNTQVWDTEPLELTTYPSIILSNAGGNVNTGGLGDMVSEYYDQMGELKGYRYGGMYDLNFTLEIAALNTFTREFLTDLVIMALRVQLKRKIEAEGILIKDIRYSSESVVNFNNNKYYVSTINLTTFSQWYEDIDFTSLDDVNISIGGN